MSKPEGPEKLSSNNPSTMNMFSIFKDGSSELNVWMRLHAYGG